MSQIKSPDQEAAELLPCLELIERGKPCSSTAPCYVCAIRPAVAERLANYREQVRQRDRAMEIERAAYLKSQERIAALEAELKDAKIDREHALADLHGCQDGAALRDERARRERLEAENERLKRILFDQHYCFRLRDAVSCWVCNEFDLANSDAALAGRGK